MRVVLLYLQLKHTVSMPEKISICLNRGRKESEGIKWLRFYCLRPQVKDGKDDVNQKNPKRVCGSLSIVTSQ